jgi:energy-coupling factor transport system ATP-binding protein
MMKNETEILSIDQVTYRYGNGNEPALNDLDLKIEKGTFTSIMGKTGAGKTTLLMLLNGLIPHFFDGELQGTVTTARLNTQRYHIQTLVRRIGLVLQDPETQILGVTVEKDVSFGPCNLGFPAENIKKIIPEVLQTVGLENFEKRVPANLSGGEKQRLAIAGVLAMQPLILALDEPTSELDPVSRKQLFETCHRLCSDHGYTVMCSTHDTEEALGYSDRIVVLNHGDVVREGDPRRLFSDIDFCYQNGLRPPAIAELIHSLHENGIAKHSEIPLTIPEGINLLEGLLQDATIRYPERDNGIHHNRSTEPVIKIRDLHHRYDTGQEALAGISLEIYPGEFVALVGQNGAGKSTFVKHLNGLLQPTTGEVFINGTRTVESDTSTLGKTIGYVFQNPDHQIFSASVREEVAFGLRHIRGIDGAEAEEKIRFALNFVELEDKIDRHPFSLGKGERQKLAVASVLAVEPDVLVIDEPTTGLDWIGTQKMMKLITRLHSLGHTVLIITHDMQLAADYADRVLVLNRGKLLADGSPEEVFVQFDLLEQASLIPPPGAVISKELLARGIPVAAVRMRDLEKIITMTVKDNAGYVH